MLLKSPTSCGSQLCHRSHLSKFSAQSSCSSALALIKLKMLCRLLRQSRLELLFYRLLRFPEVFLLLQPSQELVEHHTPCRRAGLLSLILSPKVTL